MVLGLHWRQCALQVAGSATFGLPRRHGIAKHPPAISSSPPLAGFVALGSGLAFLHVVSVNMATPLVGCGIKPVWVYRS